MIHEPRNFPSAHYLFYVWLDSVGAYHMEKTYTKDFLSKNKSVQISTLLYSKVINYKGQAINLIGAFYIEKDHQNVDP